jgi:hypothetical protein
MYGTKLPQANGDFAKAFLLGNPTILAPDTSHFGLIVNVGL